MRAPAFRIILAAGLLAAGSAATAAGRAAHPAPSLTLYEKPDFKGRHVVFHGESETVRTAFMAKSARSVGLWTLCTGRDPASKCQTVNGAAATLKLEPAIVRPGVDAVALFAKPGLKGKRVVYSFASDTPPPFRPQSARTWGGAWSICDASSGRCQVIDSQRPVEVTVPVNVVEPGRPPERLTLALASPPPAAAAATEQAPSPEPPPPPARPRPAAAPPAPAPAPAEVAEASPPPRAEPPQSAYVEIPLPPRQARPESGRAPGAELAPRPEQEVRRPAQPLLRRSPLRRVVYACADGQGLTVLFDDRDRTATVLADDHDPVALRRTRDGERGFFYEGSGHVLFGAGRRAGFAAEGSDPVDCYVRGARRELSSREDDFSRRAPREPDLYPYDRGPDDAYGPDDLYAPDEGDPRF